jgi:hypothetical protein
MSCKKNIKHCWKFLGMDFVYGAKVYGNIEEMELLTDIAKKYNVSMIYTAETFNDCGEREIINEVYGVWFQENHPETNENSIDAMWEKFKVEKHILLTGWHEKSGDC